jgi:TolB protein
LLEELWDIDTDIARIVEFDVESLTERTVLTEEGSIRLHAFSPDGNQVLSTTRNTEWTLEAAANYWKLEYRDAADLAKVQRVTNQNGCEVDPSWSPDGSSVLFASSLEGNWDIMVASVTSTESVHNLTRSSRMDDEQPFWSPDGERVVFVHVETSGVGGSDFVQEK